MYLFFEFEWAAYWEGANVILTKLLFFGAIFKGNKNQPPTYYVICGNIHNKNQPDLKVCIWLFIPTIKELKTYTIVWKK